MNDCLSINDDLEKLLNQSGPCVYTNSVVSGCISASGTYFDITNSGDFVINSSFYEPDTFNITVSEHELLTIKRKKGEEPKVVWHSSCKNNTYISLEVLKDRLKMLVDPRLADYLIEAINSKFEADLIKNIGL